MKYRLEPGRLEERFAEWKPAYSKAEAIAEANRCLYCSDAPCIKACPTQIDIPTFIKKIANENVAGSARTILSANILGYSCARVCPVEVLCVGHCVYNQWGRAPIQIGKLQRFAVESAWKSGAKGLLPASKPASGKRVALVGAGPASIAAAALLAREGHRAVIFEKSQIPGGLNSLGIAPYKMQGGDAMDELNWVADHELIELRCGVEVVAEASGDAQVAVSSLLSDFDAVFLAIGIGGDTLLPSGNGGAPSDRVVGATEWIEKIKGDPSYRLPEGVRRALVVGGGNTALDAAHELRVLGVPEVFMVYRRSQAEMSGYAHELAAARKDGVHFVENRAPLACAVENGALVGLKVAEAKGGRPIEGREELIAADLIIVAIGQDRARHTQFARHFPGVELDPKGRVVVDPATQRTGNAKVWSGGDCVNGGKEVVNAVEHAKIAVRDICNTFNGAHHG